MREGISDEETVKDAVEFYSDRKGLDELKESGVKTVRVLDEARISEMIHAAVMTSLEKEKGRIAKESVDRVSRESRKEMDRMLADVNQHSDRAETEYKKKIAELEEKARDKEGTKVRLRQLEKEVESTKEEKETKRREAKNLLNQTATLEDRLARAERNAVERVEKLHAVERDLADLKGRTIEEERLRKKAEEELQSQSKTTEDLLQECDRLRSTVGTLQKEQKAAENLKGECDRLRVQVADLQRATREEEKLRKRVSDLEGELKARKQRMRSEDVPEEIVLTAPMTLKIVPE